MLPPAPGLFSTTTCWPHISDSRAPTMRPMPSMPPPGVNGTTSLTKRVGQSLRRRTLRAGHGAAERGREHGGCRRLDELTAGDHCCFVLPGWMRARMTSRRPRSTDLSREC